MSCFLSVRCSRTSQSSLNTQTWQPTGLCCINSHCSLLPLVLLVLLLSRSHSIRLGVLELLKPWGSVGNHCAILRSPDQIQTIFGKKLQPTFSLNSLNALQMWLSHLLPKAMFPHRLCHWGAGRVTVNLNCPNLMQIIRSLAMLVLERGGKGIGCDTAVKPDRLGGHRHKWGRQERMKEGICLIYAQSSQSLSLPMKDLGCRDKKTKLFVALC